MGRHHDHAAEPAHEHPADDPHAPDAHGAPHDHDDHHAHDHGHAHGHHHHHGSNARTLGLVLVFNALFLAVEAGVGLWSGSLALLSDAAHMLSDVAALTLAVIAARLARRPASSSRTFGLVRAEVIGAFVNALTLLAACGFIFFEAAERLVGPPRDIPGGPVLVVAALGLLVNLGSAYVLWRGDRANINVRGALVHMMADALGSVGAMTAALFVLSGVPLADPIVSVLIGLIVLVSAFGVLKDSLAVLLQFAPVGLGADEIQRALGEVEGVEGVHDVHVWVLTTGQPTVSAHLVAGAGAEPYSVLERAERALRDRLGVAHSTLQVDPAGGPECRQRRCCTMLGGAA